MGKLTDIAIKKLEPGPKPYKKWDGDGLYLEVKPGGGKFFRYKYRIGGKENIYTIGRYPEVGLREAREELADARKLVSKGIDPNKLKQAERGSRAEAAQNTFEAIARECLLRWKPSVSEGHSKTTLRRLENKVFPWVGHKPIEAVSIKDLQQVLDRIVDDGHIETARRVRGICHEVFRFAIRTQRAKFNPAEILRGPGIIPATKTTHHAAITNPDEVGQLLRVIESYQGHPTTLFGLKFIAQTFVRSGEMRRAEWSEFRIDEALWEIPAERMKTKRKHLVPLSSQTLELLECLRLLTGGGRYLFPSVRSVLKPMSENTLVAALRGLGYTKNQMTAHGFRSMASTLLNEQGWRHDVIERQLAHVEGNSVRAAYNHADYLSERREMMQAYADYLDQLRKGVG
jgi:integrase